MKRQDKNFTKIEHDLFEALLLSDLNKREIGLALLTIRLTIGCQKSEAILRQCDLDCIGIGSNHAKNTIKSAVNKKIICFDFNKSQVQVSPFFIEKIEKTTSLKRKARLNNLIHRQLRKTSQNGNTTPPNLGIKTFPKEELPTTQKSNNVGFPKKEESRRGNSEFVTPKDILKHKYISDKKVKSLEFNLEVENRRLQTNRDEIMNPFDYEPKDEQEFAAKEVWYALEPSNTKALQNTYLRAVDLGLPTHLFYQFKSEIEQDPSIENQGAVFTTKLKDWLLSKRNK